MNHRVKRIQGAVMALFLTATTLTGLPQPDRSRVPNCVWIPDSAVLAADWFDQGNRALLNRDLEPALRAFKEALRLASDDRQRAAIHQNLGSIYFLLADFQKAAVHFEFSLHLLDRDEISADSRAELCLNIGFTCLETEDPGQALKWFHLADRSLPSGSFPWQLRLALGAGNVHLSRGDYRTAIGFYTGWVNTRTPGRALLEEEIWLWKNLAWAYQILGVPDTARMILEQTLEQIRIAGEGMQQHVPEILLQEALLLKEEGAMPEAYRLLETAWELLPQADPIFPADNDGDETLSSMDVLRYRILKEMASVTWLRKGGKKNDAPEAAEWFAEIVEVIELGERLVMYDNLRGLVALDPSVQRSLTGMALLLLLCMHHDAAPVTSGMVDLAERLERFEKICYGAGIAAQARSDDPLRSGLHLLRKQLFRLHKQRELEQTPTLSPAPRKSRLIMETIDRLDSLESLEARGSCSHRTGIWPTFGRDVFSETVFCTLLENDEALIRYLVCDSTLFIFLFTSDTCMLITRTRGDLVLQDAGKCLSSLKGLDPSSFSASGHRLYRALIEPVEKWIGHLHRLHVVPDRRLMSLPFDVLLMPGSSGRPGEEEFLINRYETTIHTSLSAWYSDRTGLPGTPDPKLYEFDLGACAPEFSGIRSAPLPHALSEVELISRLFQSRGKRVSTLTRSELDEASFLRLANHSMILHLATHGYSDPVHPEFSGWVLPGDPSPSPEQVQPEERMEIGALQSLCLHTDLLVLSSCPVGTGAGKRGYRITAFPENFFQAGIHHIMFSLWDVSDRHTSRLMQRFYRNHLDGMTYSGALRAAKLEMLLAPETSFPAMWAAFVLWND